MVVDAVTVCRQRRPRTSNDRDREPKLFANDHGWHTLLSKENFYQKISKAEAELEISSDGDLFPWT